MIAISFLVSLVKRELSAHRVTHDLSLSSNDLLTAPPLERPLKIGFISWLHGGGLHSMSASALYECFLGNVDVPELSMGWVYSRVGLGWVGLGWE